MFRKSIFIRLLPWIILLLVSGFLVIKLQKSRNRISELQADLARLTSIQRDTSMHEGHLAILSNIFDQIDDELCGQADRSLSEETIHRISLVSDALLPRSYSYVEKDSLSRFELSRERGLLLRQLIAYHLSDDTFSKIKAQTTFSRAYLEKADLRGALLNGIQLAEAHLKGADLRDAVLDSADLRGANLWGGKLQGASGRQTRLNRADLRWANLDSADLQKAVLDGAFLEGAKLREANLEEAVAAYAFFQRSMLGGADLTGIRLFKTNLFEADLSRANLQDADLRECDISGAKFRSANLKGVLFRNTGIRESNWLELLGTLEVTGADSISNLYEVAPNPSFKSGYALVTRE